jgi:signal transduction histidine kinase
MKSDFIHQISHEIRTPLNVLSGFTQILTTPGMELDDEQKADFSQRITENSDRITRLVNKMLELSEANSKARIEREDRVSPVQIATQAVDESGIRLARHVELETDYPLESDTTLLTTNLQQASRALAQLLDNAQKFSKQGVVRLLIRTTPQMVSFVVEDTGIGIPIYEAEHIFDEFVQLDEYYDGTGIGLTVARSIARRLEGDVMLDTSYTEGARFVMMLPR